MGCRGRARSCCPELGFGATKPKPGPLLNVCPKGNALLRISPRVTSNSHLLWNPVLAPPWFCFIRPKCTHWVTPPKLLSTTKAVIFSFTAPVAASVIGVLAKTVKMSARPPLLWKNEGVFRVWRAQWGLQLG